MVFSKHIVSVSLGSSRRNHRAEIKLLGFDLLVERRGTDGCLEKAASLLQELDGRVDVLALGGVNLYLVSGGRRYFLRDGARLARVVQRTPLVDGTGIKAGWEKSLVSYLQTWYGWPREGQVAFISSVLDRFGLAEGLAAAGCKLIIGDAMFALKIPVPFYSLKGFNMAAFLTMPLLSRLPISWLYPLGKKQVETRPRFKWAYKKADILAGDFHFLRRHMPEDLSGKYVITSTITPEDRQELRRRGVRRLVTSAPEINGRSFGANVLEAICVALLDMPLAKITPDMYLSVLREARVRPGVFTF